MKFYALNGSPRKKGNTAELLESSMRGIRSVIPSAQTEIVHVYDYLYSGCVSCYACKRVGGRYYGNCAKQDAISDILSKISMADGIVAGSPIYFHDITGQLRSFLERLLYPYLVYGKEYYSIAPSRMQTAFIYTMNATEDKMEQMDYRLKLSAMEEYMGIVFSEPEIMYCCDTCQFKDYRLYMAERFSGEEKLKRRQEHFPVDIHAAYELGIRMAKKAVS